MPLKRRETETEEQFRERIRDIKRASAERNRERNREKKRLRAKASYYRHQEAHKERAREYARAHKSERAAYAKSRLERLREDPEYNAQNRARVRAWAAANPERARAHVAEKESKRRGVEPPWANRFFIREIYDLAQRRSAATGFKWHVDHVVPLRSPLVCGLHVEHNLAVIPGAINQSKASRYWPDMP